MKIKLSHSVLAPGISECLSSVTVAENNEH